MAFAGAFVLSYAQPLLVERAARELLRIELQRRVEEKLESLSDSQLAGLAERALRRTDLDIERAQQAIHDDVAGKVANTVANMLDAGCECRRHLVAGAREFEAKWLLSLSQVRERLGELIESGYASVRQDLLREFRIFTGSNAVAFALLVAVTLFRGMARLQLLLPALVLVGAVVVSGGLYLFNQDWLHTLVFGDYLGLGYTAYLAGVSLLLADIALNRARVTTRLVNAVLNAVGAAASALPC